MFLLLLDRLANSLAGFIWSLECLDREIQTWTLELLLTELISWSCSIIFAKFTSVCRITTWLLLLLDLILVITATSFSRCIRELLHFLDLRWGCFSDCFFVFIGEMFVVFLWLIGALNESIFMSCLLKGTSISFNFFTLEFDCFELFKAFYLF